MQSLAVLYDRRPKITHADQQAADVLASYVIDAGLWPLMQRVQRDTLGMREMLIRVDVTLDRDEAGTAEVTYRPIPPDLVLAHADPEHPDEPVEVRELRLRRDRHGKPRWTWDVLSVADYEMPYYRVVSEIGRAHV